MHDFHLFDQMFDSLLKVCDDLMGVRVSALMLVIPCGYVYVSGVSSKLVDKLAVLSLHNGKSSLF
jgi:hypothetical protein